MKDFLRIVVLLLILVGCTERERNNPFDPNSHVPTDEFLSLSVTAVKNGFLISWRLFKDFDIDSVLLYRSAENDSSYVKIHAFTPEEKVFPDTMVPASIPVFYSAAVQAGGRVTRKILPVRRVFGTNSYLVHSIYGYAVYLHVYDFQEVQKSIYLNYPYYYWLPDLRNNRVFLSSYNYDHIFELDTMTWKSEMMLQISRPGPMCMMEGQLLVASVEEHSRLYKIDPDSRVLLQTFILPVQISVMFFLPDLGVIALATDRMYLFDRNFSVTDSLLFPEEQYVSSNVAGNSVICLYQKGTERILRRITLPDLQEEELMRSENMGNSFLVVNDTLYWEELGENASLVKQIIHGPRLYKTGYFFDIHRLKRNPFDGNIMVIDRYNGRFSVYHPDGRLVLDEYVGYDPNDVEFVK